jgi:hypothetical protein
MRKRRVKLLNNKYIICTVWNKMKPAAQIRMAYRKDRERKNGALKSHVFTSGLFWLTLNLALIIQCLSWNNIFIFFNFTYPLRCLRLPPGGCVPQVEYHWYRAYAIYVLGSSPDLSLTKIETLPFRDLRPSRRFLVIEVSRQIGCPETSVTTKLRCITSQRRENLIYTAPEALNHPCPFVWFF